MLCILIALTGCSKKEKTGSTEQTQNDDPVTLKVFQLNAEITDEEFQKYFIDPVKKKHPNITLQLVRSTQETTPEGLLSSGEFPDIIYTSDKSIELFNRLGVPADLNPLVKKNKFNLETFEPSVLETVKVRSKNGELLGIPFSQNVGVLIYNKDLFNKFGVPYPTDGLDWDQVIGLARKLTRNEDGIQYIGFDQPNIHLFGLGLSLPYVDPKTNKAAINNNSWQRVYKTAKDIYEIPGYIGPDNKFKYGVDGFFKTRNVALFAHWLNSIQINVISQSAQGLDWDLVSQPNYKEALGTGREVDTHLLMISNLSKHQDQAFRVISAVSGEEVQLTLSKEGRISVLNNPEIQKNYAANLPQFKGKNIEAIFKAKPRKTHSPITEYDNVVRDTIGLSAQELAIGSKDINTLLRETEEKANAAIEAVKVK